ncbi:MAG: sulfotransferase family protein [Acidimicrobiales bacterium]
MSQLVLEADQLVEAATTATGLDDLGEDTWQEGLGHLLEALCAEARLHELGVQVATGEIVAYLSNRLAITDWRKQHPEIATADVVPPLVIMGQGRTGTTILYDLLAQDPATRVPLTWEVDRPCPPPETATYDDDARIDEVEALQAAVELLIPGFRIIHPIGARLAQECVRMTAGDFRSLIFPTQYRVPSYRRWLVYEADLAPAYRWHRRYLQHLQSAHPTRRWLLKSPAHVWHLGELLAEYPGALLVQTHRDPLRIMASLASLMATLRRLASDQADPRDIAAEWAYDVVEGLDRSVTARLDGTIRPEQIVDVQFTELTDDPMAVVARIYDQFGFELSRGAEARMRGFLDQAPHAGPGVHSYSFKETGLDETALRDRVKRYQEYFSVPSEQII